MSQILIDTKPMADSLVDAMSRVSGHVDDISTIETFFAIALQIIARTNPTKVREAARLVEIQSRIQPGVTKQ